MVQIEDEKVSVLTQVDISNSQVGLKNLLEEREQAISLAQSICPVYDETNSFWIIVADLSQQITENKKQIESLRKVRNEKMSAIGIKSTTMADSLLNNICGEGYTFPGPLKRVCLSELSTPSTFSSNVPSTVEDRSRLSGLCINTDIEAANEETVETHNEVDSDDGGGKDNNTSSVS